MQPPRGDGVEIGTGVYFWGAKLNKGAVDPYTAVGGQIFYANTEYNIKNYTIDLLEGYMGQALDGTLTSPSPNAGFYSYYDSTAASDYAKISIQSICIIEELKTVHFPKCMH